MILTLSPYIIIVIVFFGTIACLLFFALSIEFVRKKIVPKRINKTKADSNASYRQAKIYTMIYETNEISEEEVLHNFDNINEVINDLNDMCNTGSIEKTIKDNKAYYKIKK